MKTRLITLILCAALTSALYRSRALASPAATQAAAKTIRVCAVAAEGCDYLSLADGASALRDGDKLVLAPGLYHQGAVVSANGVTLRGEPGAHIQSALVEQRAALVIKGSDTLVEGLECSEIRGPFRNGACIRAEGHNITLRNVRFHDSEEGLIATDKAGTIIIEDSLFEHLGGADGHAHAIYINQAFSFELRRSRILSSEGTGHEVKSRAGRTLIEDTVIAGLSGHDSRQIDISNGGIAVIRASILEKGPNSSESDVIGYGLEGLGWDSNSLTIENCLIVMDRTAARVLRSTIPARLDGNRIVGANDGNLLSALVNRAGHLLAPSRFGDSAVSGQGGAWYVDRQAAWLDPFPWLPDGVSAR